MPAMILTGITAVREAIDAGLPFDQIIAKALVGAEGFAAAREKALLY